MKLVNAMKVGDLVCSTTSVLYVFTLIELDESDEYFPRGFEVPGSGPFVYCGMRGCNNILVLIMLPSGALVEALSSKIRLL